MLRDITPVVLTFDEEPNIGRTLERLRWAPRVLVVDSGSGDGTVAVAKSFKNVEVLTRAFDDFASQWNFAVDSGRIETPWMLALDADYVLSERLVDELRALTLEDDVGGVRVRFRYCVGGRPLRGTLYPPATVLVRLDRVRFDLEGHAYRARVHGRVVDAVHSIDHDDRKDFGRWLSSQRRYAREEAEHVLLGDTKTLRWPARVRRLGWLAPILVPFHVLFVKGVIRDGWPGIRYAAERAIAEAMIAVEIANRRMAR